MTKKFRTSLGDTEIEELFIERETKASVWIDGERWKKKGGYYEFFDTEEDAKKMLKQYFTNVIAEYHLKIEHFNKQINRAKKKLESVNRL